MTRIIRSEGHRFVIKKYDGTTNSDRDLVTAVCIKCGEDYYANDSVQELYNSIPEPNEPFGSGYFCLVKNKLKVVYAFKGQKPLTESIGKCKVSDIVHIVKSILE